MRMKIKVAQPVKPHVAEAVIVAAEGANGEEMTGLL